MDYKKELEKVMKEKQLLSDLRYRGSQSCFVVFWLVFFLNYFFVGARFVDSVFVHSLPFTYIFFIVSLGFYTYYIILRFFKLPVLYVLVLQIALWVLFGIFSLPFFF